MLALFALAVLYGSHVGAQNTSLTGAYCTNLDQYRNAAPPDLTLCGNASLFTTFRPTARFIAPEGWMNDPMGLYQRADGSIHAGYQSHPQHIQWGNISMGAAHSPDFTYWTDFGSEGNYKTIWPSVLYDIRGVFDGSIIKEGYNGYPTILYTSTFTSPLGATAGEIEGSETQSIAYTEDDGQSWIKLAFGAGGNPVITNWPSGYSNLTGFRDPYVFLSPRLSALLSSNSTTAGNSSTNDTAPSGDHFLTLSGGVVGEGSKLFLYRQTRPGDVTQWTFLGPFLETGLRESWGPWSGNYGINFETAAVTRLNTAGESFDAGENSSAVDFVFFGTEQGRDSHEAHWPLWSAVDYTRTANGSVHANITYSGVIDWGRTYAFVSFPVNDSRTVLVGWTYEDDESLTLAKQQGYQGAFTLFRDLYLRVVENVDPASPGLYEKGSWSVSNNADNGSVTITTLGQRVVSETNEAYRQNSNVSSPASRTLNTTGYIPFETQPSGRHYAITGMFNFDVNATSSAGFRVLSSGQEYTDILYNPVAENLTITRSSSSLIKSYGNDTEYAKLRLWKTLGSTQRQLNLTVYVDNSVVEVYANDEATITTRVYPWLSNSTGAGLLSNVNATGAPVRVSRLELWDGLVNAWPNRATNSSLGLVWDGPFAAFTGLWTGI